MTNFTVTGNWSSQGSVSGIVNFIPVPSSAGSVVTATITNSALSATLPVISGAYLVTFQNVIINGVAGTVETFEFASPNSAVTANLNTIVAPAPVVVPTGQPANQVTTVTTPSSPTGSTKWVSVGDQGWAGCQSGQSTNTVGTSEIFFIVGQATTGLSAAWTNFYVNSSVDTDGTTTIAFNASVRVVSSTNPGTATGTAVYRLTFNGRTTATLDPGGKIIADRLAISLLPGDVVAVRTYLSSGTAWVPRETFNAIGGFTATTDLTGSTTAISGSIGWYYGPALLLGDGTAASDACAIFGDSIAYQGVDTSIITMPQLGNGGPFLRALSGEAGIVNCAFPGEFASQFYLTGGSFHRMSLAQTCTSAIIEYGSNDFAAGETAAQVEAYNLDIATAARRLGIATVYLTTVTPRTTSTDYWATTTNQTPVTGESQRVSYNTWVRAGAPINPSTLAPVTVGTAGALYAGTYGHPITGYFDTAATVETSLNSGLWLPASRTCTGSMTAGVTGGVNNVITSSNGNFVSGNQETGGDLGSTVVVVGAGVSGAALLQDCNAVISSTQIWLTYVASTTVTNATVVMGMTTPDGVHPSGRGCYLMAQAINTALL